MRGQIKNPPKGLLSVAEVAQRLNITNTGVFYWMKPERGDHQLKPAQSIPCGSRPRHYFKPDDVQRLINYLESK